MKRILSSVLSLLLAHLMYAQHAVDLGLSVLWADRNVGADSPGSPGIFVSWGELEPKSEYLMSNYRFCTGDFCSPTKYYAYNPDEVLTVPDGKTVLEPDDDVATVMMGSSWRTPLYDELMELTRECQWDWVEDDPNPGYRVTGPNGNSIFLPAAGIYTGSRHMLGGQEGYYWSSQSLFVQFIVFITWTL